MTRKHARRIVMIGDPEDLRIDPYRNVRERDLVGRRNRFVVEGEVPVAVLLTKSFYSVESMLVAENRFAAIAPHVDAMGEDFPIYMASRAVMDSIVGFPIHRGLLAIGVRGRPVGPEIILPTLPERALVLGLIGITNHDNVGGIFRNAAAFGANTVLLDNETCDPHYRKAIRVSAGGSLVTIHTRSPSANALLDSLEAASFELLALSPSGRESIADIRRAPRTALLLGTEGPGLPDAILARCRTVSIPMPGPFMDSLNVATASGIALHRLSDS